MGSNTVKTRSMQQSMDSILQDALVILEADDGKSFEEKKAVLLRMLTDKQDALLAKKVVDIALTEKMHLKSGNPSGDLVMKLSYPTGLR